MFTKTTLLALAATMATAAPTTRQADTIINFEALSSASTTVVHLDGVTASGNLFYLDGTSSASCPTDQCPAIDCSQYTTTTTIFSIDTTTGYLSLDVAVPGGQVVWVDSTGALGFSAAGDSTVPSGVSLGPWTYAPPVDGDSVGTLQFNGENFEACPDSTGGYQVFAQGVAGYVAPSNCISIDIITAVWKGAEAYQYN